MDQVGCTIITDTLSADHTKFLEQFGATIHGQIGYLPAYSITISETRLTELEANRPSWIQRII